MTDRPEPCPFAHDVERGPFVSVDDEEFDVAAVKCGDCGACGPFVDLSDFASHDAAQAEAVRRWNAKAPQ